MFDIKENLKKLPNKPGVYLHKDKLGNVIYVGKAVSLKNRVRQYFQSQKNMDAKVRAMVSNIEEFEYIICDNELEALVLENNLIKKYKPKYNVLLRDDKTYPYICITNEKWPRIIKTRLPKKDGGTYFGPYSDVSAVNNMIDLLNSIYKIKKCSAKVFKKGFRPCLNYHIKQCDGICVGKADHDAYMKRIDEVSRFLKGKQKDLLSYIKSEMENASERLDYENAARYRDYISAAKAIAEKQRVTLAHTKDMDLILYAQNGNIAVFYVRDGKLSGRETFSMRTSEGDSENDILLAFIKQYYVNVPNGPSEILLQREIDEEEELENFLSALWNKKVRIHMAKRGEKRAFMQMALDDMTRMVTNIEQKENNKREREAKIREQITGVIKKATLSQPTIEVIDKNTGEILALKKDEQASERKLRVEAYDISNTNGTFNVGSMVVYDEGRPNKKAYRRFKIRTVAGADDYASMQEVIYRRVKNALAGDRGFLPLADLMLIDGGKGHVHAVLEVLRELDISLAVVGMAKDDFHRTRALVYPVRGTDGTIAFAEEELKENELLFKYIGSIQEEVHRFAIDYHKRLRDKDMTHSILDDIEGIGKVKRMNLLRHFKDIEKIKNASEEELLQVPKITKKNAENIVNFFLAQTESK